MGFHASFMYIELHTYTMQNSEKNKGGTDAEQFHVPIWYVQTNVPCPRTIHERLVSRSTTSRAVDLIVIASFGMFVVGVLTSVCT